MVIRNAKESLVRDFFSPFWLLINNSSWLIQVKRKISHYHRLNERKLLLFTFMPPPPFLWRSAIAEIWDFLFYYTSQICAAVVAAKLGMLF